ncbi:MAG TPA: L-threonylcarbamoyladenylate synthase [Fibrobacteraceae bacterium]|nr:L-threonylcarbamoyladenylate synthase [Fibrobacteraceae bacterium]
MSLRVVDAVQILTEGGIVGMPTETVYGLAANAFRADAIAKVFEAKERPWFDPLIVHLPSPDWLSRVASSIPPAAMDLAQKFWPGPLTLVLPKRPEIPDLVTAGLPTVAVRIPAHPLALELIRACDFPLAAPSANLFGKVSPTCAQDVWNQLDGRISGVLDGGPCEVGVESSIVDLTGAQPTLLRPGGLAKEELEMILGPLALPHRTSSPAGAAMSAPGSCSRHYSPETPLHPVGSFHIADKSHVGLIAFGPDHPERFGFAVVENLSPNGDLHEAATHLYSTLRKLDAQELEQILVEPIPEYGLGLAINDRLRRASTRD